MGLAEFGLLRFHNELHLFLNENGLPHPRRLLHCSDFGF